MQSSNIKPILEKITEKLNHQIVGSAIITGRRSENFSPAASSHQIDKGIGILQLRNDGKEVLFADLLMPKSLVVFAFALQGKFELLSSVQNTFSTSKGDTYFMMALPFEDWDIQLRMDQDGRVGLLCLTVQGLHEIFDLDVTDKVSPEVLSKSYRMKSFCTTRTMKPSVAITTAQLFQHTIKADFARIYEKGKVMEFLTHYMDQSTVSDKEKNDCPFVLDNLEKEKLVRVEQILLDNMVSPPSIADLAKIVGTNEFKLKQGFKYLYGNTVYGYLIDHRLNTSLELLRKKDCQIKDIAYSVGYTNPSHFIAAFKKKFGVTPKKYLQET